MSRPRARAAARPATHPPRASSSAAPTRVLALMVLAAATLATFSGALKAGWIPLDDPFYVTRDPDVSRGWSFAAAARFLTRAHAHNWHPLTSWSHMLDVEWFGLVPAAHHGVSLVFHVLNALLLVLVLYRLTGAWWRSALVGACFALHPLRVESVVWVSERKDVLSAFWFLIAVDLHRRWVARPTLTRRAGLAVAFALGLMAKPMVVTLPAVLVLLDLWPLRRLAGLGPARADRPGVAPARSISGLVLEKWPLLALAAAGSVVTFLVQRKTGAMVSTSSIPLDARLANAGVAYWGYVLHTLWPSGLAIFYPFRDLGAVAPIAAGLGLAAVTLATLKLLRSRPYLAVGWLWYLGMLIPVIGIVQVGVQASADRYTYLPCIGLVIAIVWGVAGVVERSRPMAAVAVAAACLTLLASAMATARYVALWQDPRRLFEHALAVTPSNPIAHEGLGDALIDAGQIEQAIPHLEIALRLEPNLPQVESNLGSALGSVGRYDEALEHFRAVLAKRESAEIHFNMAQALVGRGTPDEAIPEFEAAIRLDPGARDARAGFAALLFDGGHPEGATAQLEQAIALAEAAGEHAEAQGYRNELARRLGR